MADTTTVELDVLPTTVAVCRLEADAPLPAWVDVDGGDLVSVTRRRGELSVVCPESVVPADALAERGWRVLAVRGPLDFALTGILAALAVPLAAAGVPIFALSTHDTDLVLVQGQDLPAAVDALVAAGHTVHEAVD